MGQEKRARKSAPPKRAARSVSNSRTSPDAIEHCDDIARACELRRDGFTFAQIAAAMGLQTPSAAWKLVEKGMERIVREPAEALRKLENERLDAALRAVCARALGVSEPAELQALDRYLKISEARRKLFGLDAPAQHEVKTTVTQTGDQLRNEIAEVFDRLVAADEAQEHGGN